MANKQREMSEVAKEIVEAMQEGDYDQNLVFSVKHAALAVTEDNTESGTYLLLQSIAQSNIAIVLLLEDIAGRLEGGGN